MIHTDDGRRSWARAELRKLSQFKQTHGSKAVGNKKYGSLHVMYYEALCLDDWGITHLFEFSLYECRMTGTQYPSCFGSIKSCHRHYARLL